MRPSGPKWREFRKLWWAAVDSNHLPPRYQHGALPVELAARTPHALRIKADQRSLPGPPILRRRLGRPRPVDDLVDSSNVRAEECVRDHADDAQADQVKDQDGGEPAPRPLHRQT